MARLRNANQGGLTTPFVLSALLFAAVIADRIGYPADFVASAAWRGNEAIAAVAIALAIALWGWVLAASARRGERFEGPIVTARGRSGVLQPLLATVFIVLGANAAYSELVPKWLNALTTDGSGTVEFTVRSVAAFRNGCAAAEAEATGFGITRLCLPEATAAAVEPGVALAVRGPVSWFGIEPRRYGFAAPSLLTPATDDPPLAADPVEPDPVEPDELEPDAIVERLDVPLVPPADIVDAPVDVRREGPAIDPRGRVERFRNERPQ